MAGPYINLNMRPIPNLSLHQGHLPENGDRSDKWDVKENLSPSVLDPLFGEIREAHAAGKSKTEAKKAIKIDLTTTEQVALLTDKCARMVLSKDAIVEHMEERIAAFLVQMIDCYDTDLYFTIGHTQNQTESTPAIQFVISRGIQMLPEADKKMTFASAHHGTIPCLYAYPRAEWDAWKVHNNPDAPGKPQAKVYLNKSDTYYCNNACTGLATVINQADIDLDGNPTEKHVEFSRGPRLHANKKLREITIGLLNRVAKKEITPIQGFGLYMGELKRFVDNLAASHSEGENQIIFSTWKELLDELHIQYAGNYKFFIARMLGVHVPVGDRNAINLESLIYPRHFKMMQRKNCYQTELSFRVDKLNKKLHGNSNLKTFEKAFKAALLKEAVNQDEKVRQIFQRYYNANGQTADQLERECYKPALASVASDDSQRRIKKFFAKFSQYIHNFSIDQAKFSSGLAKEIRTVRGLSLRKFAEKHNQAFPTAHRLNYEQLRRIELGCVKPTPGLIGRMARVLDIHESVLSPEFA